MSSSSITRRGLLAAAAGAAITGGFVAVSGWSPRRQPALSPGSQATRTPLPIPPLAGSAVDASGTRVFALTAQAGVSDMVSAGHTPTWGYNGPFAGPTLRAREGEPVRVEVTNDLPEATTVHWHGMKLPARSDGGPHQTIAPGETWTADWTVTQPAATLWYHPHHHGTTEAHVYRGLGGLFIVDDDLSEASELPSEYGVDDVPLIVTDRSFAADGSFAEDERTALGMLGDTLLVNGAVSGTSAGTDATPEFVAARPLTRLRILNASTARSYSFMVEGAPMHLVGTDAGLLPEPVEAVTVTLTPGERAEVLVSLAPEQEAVLQSVPHSLGLMKSTARTSGTDDRFDVLVLTAGFEADAPGPDAVALTALAAAIPDALESPDETRAFRLDNDTINGKKMSMSRLDEVVTVGNRERWILTNEHHMPHNFHVHNARFTVVSVDGEPPRETERGWKDTVYTPPRRPVVIDVEFGSDTDPAWPYMYHCHLLQHEDAGMMGQFVVIGPGDSAPPEIDTPATRAIAEQGGTHVGH